MLPRTDRELDYGATRYGRMVARRFPYHSIAMAKSVAQYLSEALGVPHHVDHITPLSFWRIIPGAKYRFKYCPKLIKRWGHPDEYHNLQVITRQMNLKKGNKL